MEIEMAEIGKKKNQVGIFWQELECYGECKCQRAQ
jgi:hypothetical protein